MLVRTTGRWNSQIRHWMAYITIIKYGPIFYIYNLVWNLRFIIYYGPVNYDKLRSSLPSKLGLRFFRASPRWLGRTAILRRMGSPVGGKRRSHSTESGTAESREGGKLQKKWSGNVGTILWEEFQYSSILETTWIATFSESQAYWSLNQAYHSDIKYIEHWASTVPIDF